MTEVFRFEKGGVLFAKGFFNQEGLAFYLETFYLAAENLLRMDAGCHVEESRVLPGETPVPVLQGQTAKLGQVAQLGRATG